jgi:hypothetical protein
VRILNTHEERIHGAVPASADGNWALHPDGNRPTLTLRLSAVFQSPCFRRVDSLLATIARETHNIREAIRIARYIDLESAADSLG